MKSVHAVTKRHYSFTVLTENTRIYFDMGYFSTFIIYIATCYVTCLFWGLQCIVCYGFISLGFGESLRVIVVIAIEFENQLVSSV